MEGTRDHCMLLVTPLVSSPMVVGGLGVAVTVCLSWDWLRIDLFCLILLNFPPIICSELRDQRIKHTLDNVVLWYTPAGAS